MKLTVANIEIYIQKKKIKNLHLYVKPPNGLVSVSAPEKMSNEAIERFIRTKITWIKNQISKFDNQLRQSEREYVSGESLYLWGKQYFLYTEYDNKNSLVLSGNKAILTVRKESNAKQRENFVREWYRDILKVEITRLMPKWEKITGLKALTWQTKYMTTRWGTCNPKTRKLWFNLQLAKKPQECLEYIILHELIHLVEKHHNERFIALMDRYMPMWREIKNTLNSQILDFWE